LRRVKRGLSLRGRLGETRRRLPGIGICGSGWRGWANVAPYRGVLDGGGRRLLGERHGLPGGARKLLWATSGERLGLIGLARDGGIAQHLGIGLARLLRLSGRPRHRLPRHHAGLR
jgi:hypothetical protein